MAALSGCGAGSAAEPAVDHSSPPKLFAGFCRALAERDTPSLVSACDPPLRPVWKDFLAWEKKLRASDSGPPSGGAFLESLEERFCAEDELVFERPDPNAMRIRNLSEGAMIVLRKRGEKWYVGFSEEPADAEYTLKLATEIIKSHLGARSSEERRGKMGYEAR